MPLYANRGGRSNVAAYEVGPDFIEVEFSDGGLYIYDYVRPGRDAVEHMKRLAEAGTGLNSFISAKVRKNFARRVR